MHLTMWLIQYCRSGNRDKADWWQLAGKKTQM